MLTYGCIGIMRLTCRWTGILETSSCRIGVITIVTAVTRSTITKGVYRAIYDLLTDVTNGITDIQSPVRTRTVWILSAWPDNRQSGISKEDFPIVVVNNPTISTTRQTIKRTDVTANVIIDVYSSGNASAENLDKVFDNIYDVLRTYKWSTLRNTCLLIQPKIVDTANNIFMRGDLKVHVKSMNLQLTFTHSDV